MNLQEKIRLDPKVSKEELRERKTVKLNSEELERLTQSCFFFRYAGVIDSKCLRCNHDMYRLTCDKYIPSQWKGYIDALMPQLPPPPEKSQ